MHGTVHLFDQLPQVDEAPVPAEVHELVPATRSKPLVGLIRNPRSHGNVGRDKTAREGVGESRDDVLVETPRKRTELTAILTRFAERRVDFIAIDGGDGTVRDVLTLGAGIFGASWPTLIILPTGKTNALGHDLGIPANWSIDNALACAKEGSFTHRQPIIVEQRNNDRGKVQGFVLGAGAFTRAIALGQRGHDLGAFDNAVVALTAVWSACQAFFGKASNPWRCGVKMALRDSSGMALPHYGGLPEDERYMLFASTLRTMPGGLTPFRGIDDVLRVSVFDNVSRSLMLRIGAIFSGRASAATKARGYHVFGTDAIEADIGDAFILDGEAFPAGQYRMSAGPKLRFVVP